MIELGVTAKDRLTGFVGIVSGRAEYLTGCTQYLLNPKVSAEGTLREAHWIDEQRLEIDTGVEKVVLDNSQVQGFDKEAPKR